MQPESKPPFQMTPQVALIIVLTMGALFLPLAGVVLLMQGYFDSRQDAAVPSSPSAAGSPMAGELRTSLENVADGEMAAAIRPLDEDSVVVLTVMADQMNGQMAVVERLAAEAGGSALEMPGAEPGARRLLVTVPDSRIGLLRRAVRSEKIDFGSVASSDSTTVIEVRLVPGGEP